MCICTVYTRRLTCMSKWYILSTHLRIYHCIYCSKLMYLNPITDHLKVVSLFTLNLCMGLSREKFGNRRQLGKYNSLSTSGKKGETTIYSQCSLSKPTAANSKSFSRAQNSSKQQDAEPAVNILRQLVYCFSTMISDTNNLLHVSFLIVHR